jgi:hypothetical protein
LEDALNDKIASADLSCDSFSLLHYNIRSISRNLRSFNNLLANINYSFSVLGFSETWLCESNLDLYEIDGYCSEHNCRNSRRGGGVGLYVREFIRYKCRPDLDVFNDIMESIFIEIPATCSAMKKAIVIGVVYRPPDTDVPSFIEVLSGILNQVANERKYLYLLGDFNVNLFNCDTHVPTSEFLDAIYSSSLLPLITKPTRISNTSHSLIDNIFCNDAQSNRYISGIIVTDISDHFPVFTINVKYQTKAQQTTYKYRNYSARNIENFFSKLESHNWNGIYCLADCQTSFSLFYEQYLRLYNECFPIRISKSEYLNRKPWLTNGIKTSIKIKNKLFYISKKYPTVHNINKYRFYKRRVQGIIQNAEKEYYEHNLRINQCNMKKSWMLIKQAINKKCTKSISQEFVINGNLTSNCQIIADSFNKFYTNIGPDLARSIPQSNRHPASYIQQNNENTLFLTPTNESEICSIIKNLKNASPGHDDIHAKIIKKTCSPILKLLTHLVNLSLSQGNFPDELKIAKVIPLFKANDPTHITNYRPVSVLPVLSKLFERIMYVRLLKFINSNNLLYQYQFGFRKNHSTLLALTVLLDKISDTFNNSELIVGNFFRL